MHRIYPPFQILIHHKALCTSKDIITIPYTECHFPCSAVSSMAAVLDLVLSVSSWCESPALNLFLPSKMLIKIGHRIGGWEHSNSRKEKRRSSNCRKRYRIRVWKQRQIEIAERDFMAVTSVAHQNNLGLRRPQLITDVSFIYHSSNSGPDQSANCCFNQKMKNDVPGSCFIHLYTKPYY
jgi:hypothetical protein